MLIRQAPNGTVNCRYGPPLHRNAASLHHCSASGAQNAITRMTNVS
jgi:hypothetical protein